MQRRTPRLTIHATVVAIVLSLLVATPSPAAEEGARVDQTLDGDPACTVENFPDEPVLDALTPLRQGFVPSGGAISGVDLCLTVDDAPSLDDVAPAIVNIIAFTEGGDEEVVASTRMTDEAFEAAAGTTGYVHFSLDEVAPITPGALHAIELDAPRLTFRWRATCGGGTPCEPEDDRYAEGMATGLGGLLEGRLGILSVLAANDDGADFGFRTYLPGPGDLVVDVEAPALVCPDAASLDPLVVTVRNRGANATAPFTVDLTLDVDGAATDLGSAEVGSLAGGATHVLDGADLDLAVPTAGTPARAQVTAVVDAADVVTEFDEDNNTGSDTTTRVSCDEGTLEDLTLVAGDGGPLPRVEPGLVDVAIADLPPDAVAAGAAAFAAPDGAAAAGAPDTASPRDADTVQASPTHFSPTRFSPTHFSPTRFSPTHFSPTRFSPTRFSPTRFSPTRFSSMFAGVDPALLDGVPLVSLQTTIGWEQQLAEYPDQPDVRAALTPEQARAAADAVLAIPAQDRTLGDVLVRLDPPLDVRLHEVGLGGGLDLSLLGVALSTQPLTSVPTPSGDDWCAFIAATSFLDCATAGIDPATETFAGLDLRGYPMGQLDLTGVPLADIGLRADTVLNSIPLADALARPPDGEPAATARILRLQYTALGALPAAAAFTDPASVLVCDGSFQPDPCAGTVAAAEGAFAFREDITLVDVLGALTPDAAASLDVTNGLLAVAGGLDLPWGRFDLDPLDADVLTGGTCPAVPYTLTADVAGSVPVVDPVLSVVLPDGFDPVDGTAVASTDGGAPVALDGTDATGAVDESVTADGRSRLDVTVRAIVSDTVTVTVEACANAVLGVAVADADASWTTFDGTAQPTLVTRTVPSEDDGQWFGERHADVLVVEAEEPDDTGRVLVPETVTYRHVPEAGDVDVFEIPIGQELPGGPTVRPGDRVRIWAAPPAGTESDGAVVDIDLAVFGGERSDLTDDLLAGTPLGDAEPPILPVDEVTVADGQYGSAPPGTLQDSPTRFSPTRFSPTRFSPTRFSPTRFSAPRAVSSQRGNRTEYAEVDVRSGETGVLTVQVASYLGSTSRRPYALYYTVERAAVTDELAVCPAPTDFGAAAVSGDLPTVAADTRTLVLVNETLTRTVHGDAATDSMMAHLADLAAHPTVAGQVLPVELDDDVAAAYEAWRGDGWCDPAAANAVVGAIRELVVAATAVAPIDSVVLVGSDALLPMARLSDDVGLAPEDTYLGPVLAATQRNNPLVAALSAGAVLSDDPYGTVAPRAWEDEAVFVPELALGRLVETPADVVVATEQYLLTDGRLDADTALAAGYDFNSDGTAAAAAGLAELGADVDDELAYGGWDRATISDRLEASVPDVVALNAHTDHRALLTAAGDQATDAGTYLDEQLTTRSVQADDLPLGQVTFTIGCHFGTSVPDAYVGDGPPVLAVDGDPLDWAQLVAQRPGVLIANTGYGYGTDEAVAYSELLLSGFAGATARTGTVGAALSRAKADYLAGIATPSALHRKTLQEAVFHGIPTYRFHDTPPVVDDVPTPDVDVDPATGLETVALDTGSLTVGDPECTACLRPVAAAAPRRGVSYDLVGPGPEGDPLVVGGRAIVPQVSQRLRLPSVEVGGFVPDVLESVDVPGPDGALDAFDPVIARPLLADAGRERPTEVLDQAGPATAARTTRIGEDVVVTLPLGAFRGERHDATGEVRGRHRLDTRIGGRLYLRDTEREFVDRLSPETIDLDLSRLAIPAGDLLSVTLTAIDDGTPARGVVGLRVDGSWHLVELAVPDGDAFTKVMRGTVAVPAGAAVDEAQYWVVDDSGNVGVGHHKGLEPLERAIVPSPEVVRGDPTVTLSGDRVGDAYRSDVAVSITDGASSLYHVFVDGRPEPVATLPVGGSTVLRGTGVHEVVAVADDDADRATALAVAIDVTPPRVRFVSPDPTAPIAARTFTVGDVVGIEVACSDVLTGVVACAADDADGLLDTSTVGEHVVTASATDGVGHSATTSMTYRVESTYQFDGFKKPVDDGRVTAKAGSGIAFRYRVLDADGAELTDPTIIDRATFEQVACDGSALPGTSPVVAAEKKPVFHHGDHFHHDTITSDDWVSGTCYAYTVTLVDGYSFTALIDVK